MAPTPRYHTVSLLTDYGLEDEFVGVVKSVIRDLAPHVLTIDLTHGIAPHDVRAGALALARSIQYVAPGVVVAVVDPGVGTERRAVAIEVAGGEGVLLGPDNGLLAPAVALVGGAGRAVSLTNAAYHLPAPGPTFAGRDIFAPVAAHLCNGVELTELGEEVDPVSLRPGVVPLHRVEGATLVAEILWVDRFGNAQLNVGAEELEPLGPRVLLRFGDQARVAVQAASFEAIQPGQLGLVIDSYGLAAVALHRRSAAEELGIAAGDAVVLAEPPDGPTAQPVRIASSP